MFVLIDMEWYEYETSGRCLTQIAARRVDEEWTSIDSFDCLVRPDFTSEPDWSHMAFNGYTPDLFQNGKTVKSCIEEFSQWLKEDDTICCWHRDTKKLLRQIFVTHMNAEFSFPIKQLNSFVYDKAKEDKVFGRGIYALAKAYGIDVLHPEHCSANDVTMMSLLLQKMDVAEGDIHKPISELVKPLTKRERNMSIIERSEYNYLYIPDSKVFHSRTCKIMLSANTILGSVMYKTAAHGRCPCKICRPTPAVESNSSSKSDKATPTVRAERSVVQSIPSREIVRVKLIDGRIIDISSTKIVGICHYYLHPGKLNKQLLEEHDCLGKECRHLEKLENSPYWAALKAKQQQKENIKKKRLQRKLAEANDKSEMDELRETLQSYAEDAEYNMQIIRVEKEKAGRFRVFYVSENRFADGNRFPMLIETAKFYMPYYSFGLRHIRDVDGHFVTCEEYNSRRK